MTTLLYDIRPQLLRDVYAQNLLQSDELLAFSFAAPGERGYVECVRHYSRHMDSVTALFCAERWQLTHAKFASNDDDCSIGATLKLKSAAGTTVVADLVDFRKRFFLVVECRQISAGRIRVTHHLKALVRKRDICYYEATTDPAITTRWTRPFYDFDRGRDGAGRREPQCLIAFAIFANRPYAGRNVARHMASCPGILSSRVIESEIHVETAFLRDYVAIDETTGVAHVSIRISPERPRLQIKLNCAAGGGDGDNRANDALLLMSQARPSSTPSPAPGYYPTQAIVAFADDNGNISDDAPCGIRCYRYCCDAIGTVTRQPALIPVGRFDVDIFVGWGRRDRALCQRVTAAATYVDMLAFVRSKWTLGSQVSIQDLCRTLRVDDKSSKTPLADLFDTLNVFGEIIACATLFRIPYGMLPFPPNTRIEWITSKILYDEIVARRQYISLEMAARDDERRTFRGGYTFVSDVGTAEYSRIRVASKPSNRHIVRCVDFSCFYPSLMIAFNLCPSTYVTRQSVVEWTSFGQVILFALDASSLSANVAVEYELAIARARDARKRLVVCVLETDDHFVMADYTDRIDTYHDSVTKDVLSRLLQRRRSLRAPNGTCHDKTLDTAIKNFINGTYGVQAACRWFDGTCVARATASIGRYFVKMLPVLLPVVARPIYGDTDSLFYDVATNNAISNDDDVRRLLTATDSRLPSPVQLRYEGYYEKLAIRNKKEYAGVFVDASSGKRRLVCKGLRFVTRLVPSIVHKACVLSLEQSWLHERIPDTQIVRYAASIVASAAVDANTTGSYREFLLLRATDSARMLRVDAPCVCFAQSFVDTDQYNCEDERPMYYVTHKCDGRLAVQYYQQMTQDCLRHVVDLAPLSAENCCRPLDVAS